MDKTNLSCSLDDTAGLRQLIIENPELPLLVFCGEDAWSGEYPYEKADASGGEIKELTLYKGYWMDKDDYEESLADGLCSQGEYKGLPEEEYWQIVKQKVAETEFVKAIVIYAG